MSDIGYLQIKIRELQEKQEELSKKVEDSLQREKRFKENMKSIFDDLKKVEIDEAKIEINSLFLEEYKIFFHKIWNETYEKLHGSIISELTEQRKSNREFILKFIDEVIFQRKDLGNILSLLLKKNIVLLEEINEIDKGMLKEMSKQNVRETVFNQFYPILITKQKIEEINVE